MAKQSRRTRSSDDVLTSSVMPHRPQPEPLRPMNERQASYIDALDTSEQVFVTGCSGTGKTYIAASYAAELYLAGDVSRIIITRPNVSCGRDLGYFPGTLEEKFAPWAAPVLDVLRDKIGHGKLATDMKSTAQKPASIEVAPLSTMRGRSFQNAFILLDEAQNTTPDEMKMFLTRIGTGCKAVVNGDIAQKDIRTDSGLAYALRLIQLGQVDVPHIEFTVDDIVRGGLVRQWLVAWG